MIAPGFDDVDKAIMEMARSQRVTEIEAPAKPGVGTTIMRRPTDYSDAAWKEATRAQQ